MTVPKTKTLLLAAAGIAILAAVFAFKVQAGMADFEVNYRAGHRLGLGETLYRTADSHWQFKYSPFSAMIYLPLSVLPLPAAKAVWFLLVVTAIAAVIVFGMKLAIAAGSTKPGPAVFLAALILAKFFLRELQLGQINALITALLMGMVLLIVRDDEAPSPRRRRSAGILWGLAMALKPYAVIFLPYLVLKRKGRALAWGGAVLAATLTLRPLLRDPGKRGRSWGVDLEPVPVDTGAPRLTGQCFPARVPDEMDARLTRSLPRLWGRGGSFGLPHSAFPSRRPGPAPVLGRGVGPAPRFHSPHLPPRMGLHLPFGLRGRGSRHGPDVGLSQGGPLPSGREFPGHRPRPL